MKKYTESALMTLLILLIAASFPLHGRGKASEGRISLESILPKVSSWELSEKSETYMPENLFEYIDGAAEIYLAYDFRELIVGQYQTDTGPGSLTAEIYDMGSTENAFGIYGQERFPDNKFISMGIQGYLEEDSLNFFTGQYYVKLLCFDIEKNAADVLRSFSGDIVKKVASEDTFPEMIDCFPQKGLVANSEKYSMQNFLGYSFLQHGYLANYSRDGMAFDCFIVRGENAGDASGMLQKFLERKKEQSVEKTDYGYRLKDKYYKNVFLTVVKNYICGVMKIEDGSESLGEEYLQMLKNIFQSKGS